jgi:phytoene dehydrogenase-like protein
MSRKACVIGAGPNGLAAAIVLARAGFEVQVLEAQPTPGGAVRTLELTLPGFHHDFGSAVYPLAAGSPFFSSLPLADHGLQWIHSPAVIAHPLNDGTAVVLERDLARAKSTFGEDAGAWENLLRPFVVQWNDLAAEVLRPIPFIPKHPLLMARFAVPAMQSAQAIARRFRSARTRAFFAGLAAHSFLSLDEPLSGAFAMLMAVSAHAVGWPIARAGAQSLTDSLCGFLTRWGGEVITSSPVQSFEGLSECDLFLCDVSPRNLIKICGDKLSRGYKLRLSSFRYGPGVFKVDYALNSPVPWRAPECARAATVHVGGSFEEIAESEAAVRNGKAAERPFVLIAQPSLFDNSRAPAAKHTLWAYCHVPHRSAIDMLDKIEAQIERFAPGFGDCILARNVLSPADLERMDENLIGGDIAGGVLDFRQFLFRPTSRHYATSADNIYLCSASTPPGAGVHGMCGYHAAKMALLRWNRHFGIRE